MTFQEYFQYGVLIKRKKRDVNVNVKYWGSIAVQGRFKASEVSNNTGLRYEE